MACRLWLSQICLEEIFHSVVECTELQMNYWTWIIASSSCDTDGVVSGGVLIRTQYLYGKEP